MQEETVIEIYETDEGKCPYIDWECRLSKKIRDYVTVRLGRIRLGNFGDCKHIKGEKGLYELRMHHGPGYRIYFGKQKKKVVILFCAGNKGHQKRDIAKAKKYWKDCITQPKRS